MKIHPTLAFCIPVALIVVAAIKTEPRYPVSHTEREWVNNINGMAYVQQRIHESTLPANEAFTCDSILQSCIRDVQVQVSKAIADSTKKGGKP